MWSTSRPFAKGALYKYVIKLRHVTWLIYEAGLRIDLKAVLSKPMSIGKFVKGRVSYTKTTIDQRILLTAKKQTNHVLSAKQTIPGFGKH